ncbi:MAG: MBL fold metallo-hydrolase [Candidatus Nezhaarchaeota archaeon]|nr:MBL fold metallo-hydrolase [Candidatus Nezhaarchaeota archaeon]MCX8142599.1 MBL fold metallo-hydrolase [Candidatus Nezhaarchaeota archaeon]
MPITPSTFNGVIAYKSGTLVGDRVPYWAHFYKFKQALFDCGCPNVASEIVESVGEVSAVFITHYHEDHIGAAFRYDRVYAPEKSLNILRNPPEIPQYRKIVWGQPKPFNAIPVRDGDVVLGVKVIETPGHSFDHVCYLIDNYLFSGDLIQSSRQMVVMREENCLQIIDSLRKILKFNWSYAFGGTGIYSREDAEKYLEYLETLRERVNELYSKGKSIEEIVNIVFPSPPPIVMLMEMVSEKEWARENMVRSLINDRS